MDAKLTVPLAVSALILLTLPANAICWPWQSCATQGATATPAPTGTPEKLKSAKKPKATAKAKPRPAAVPDSGEAKACRTPGPGARQGCACV